jgi:hypothetical protein
MLLPTDHYYFSAANCRLLVIELNEAVRALTGTPGTVGQPSTNFQQLTYDIIANAEAYVNVLHAFRDQQEGAALLRKYFVRDRVQQYAGPGGSYVTSAGIAVDVSLGKGGRHSTVTGPTGTLHSRLEDVNPVFARGSDVPQDMHEQWVRDRQSVRKLYNLE